MTQAVAACEVKVSGQCACGAVQWSASQQPKSRFYCHCTICQEFNQADYADVLVFSSDAIEVVNEQKVVFRKFKAPPAVNRGVCVDCSSPVIETLSLPLFPKLTIIPSSTSKQADAYQPAAHLFYHRRKTEWQDTVRKYQSFLSSQLGFVIAIFSRR
ncbi:MAG: GFA family protein [Pseudomonadota bacterium]